MQNPMEEWEMTYGPGRPNSPSPRERKCKQHAARNKRNAYPYWLRSKGLGVEQEEERLLCVKLNLACFRLTWPGHNTFGIYS